MRIKGEHLRQMVLGQMTQALFKGKITLKQFNKAKTIQWPNSVKIIGSSVKVKKGEKKKKILTGIVYMSSEKESVPYGGFNACLFASPGCAIACLGHTSGRLRMSHGLNSKLWKTLLWHYCPDIFKMVMLQDIDRLKKEASKKKMEPAGRPNGTTDFILESQWPELFTTHSDMQFYDYTKIGSRYKRFIEGKLPDNYHLTFSRSELNHKECVSIMKAGGNVATVFQDLPKAIKTGYEGFPVYNGDLTDYRPADPNNHWIGLSVKGFVKDDTGFIVMNAEE